MTNKRKIQILKKVIKRFERIIKENYYDWQYGICDTIRFECMNKKEIKVYEDDGRDVNEYFSQEFKVRMPNPVDKCGFCWKRNKKGYQARINACKKAIERLSRELPTAN